MQAKKININDLRCHFRNEEIGSKNFSGLKGWWDKTRRSKIIIIIIIIKQNKTKQQNKKKQQKVKRVKSELNVVIREKDEL